MGIVDSDDIRVELHGKFTKRYKTKGNKFLTFELDQLESRLNMIAGCHNGAGKGKIHRREPPYKSDGPGVQIPVQPSSIRSHPGRDIEATAENADDRQEYRQVKSTEMMAKVSTHLL